MHEELKHIITLSEAPISTEEPTPEFSLEDEKIEKDIILERAEKEVADLVASGLPKAQKIATEMGTEVDSETKISLVEIENKAEIARRMLSDSLINKLRHKSETLLKKYLPNLSLTSSITSENSKIVSEKISAELNDLLIHDSFTNIYPNIEEAENYFSEYKNSLIEEDRVKFENKILEAIKCNKKIKDIEISEQTIDELRKFLKYYDENKDYLEIEKAISFFEKNKELILKDYSRSYYENEIYRIAKIHEEKLKEISSKEAINKLQELLKYEDGEYKRADEAVNFLLTNKDIIDSREYSYQERTVFDAIKNNFRNYPWEKALESYKKIPSEFFANKDIADIGYSIIRGAINNSVESKELLRNFENNFDLLLAGIKYGGFNDYFTSVEKVDIIEKIYQKNGPSEEISKYQLEDFESEDQNKILKILFEAYLINNNYKILFNIERMKTEYDQLSEEKRNELIKNFINNNTNEVLNKIEELGLNNEQKKDLYKKLINNSNYDYLCSEDNIKKLGINKDEVFNTLLEKGAVNLFINSDSFKPTKEQSELIFNSITSSMQQLKEVLKRIDSYSCSKKLTEHEFEEFRLIIEKNNPILFFKFKDIFKEDYKMKLELYSKDLPEDLNANEVESFVMFIIENFGGWEKNNEKIKSLTIESKEKRVTNRYLKQLEDLNLKLPKRVLGKIVENVKKAEQDNLLEYFKTAIQKNKTLEEIQRGIQEKLEETTTAADYFKAVHFDTLKNVLNDKRFKTQFETGSSNGTLNPHYRAEQEAKMFNYKGNENEGRTVRPNYGYMSDNENGVVGSYSDTNTGSNVSQYGNIHIKFKKEKIKDRTTVTFRDSLGPAEKEPPTPSIKPHFTSIEYNDKIEQVGKASHPEAWNSSYLEVQYHWPLKTLLIDTIYISEKNSSTKEKIIETEELVENYNKENPDNIIKIVIY